MRNLVITLLLILSCLNSAWANQQAESQYYILVNTKAWKGFMVGISTLGVATADPREAWQFRFIKAPNATGFLGSNTIIKDAPAFYLETKEGGYCSIDGLKMDIKDAEAFIIVNEKNEVVDQFDIEDSYAIVPVRYLQQAIHQSLSWSASPYSKEPGFMCIGDFSCEWQLHPVEEPHPVVVNIYHTEGMNRVPYKEAYIYWGDKKVMHGDIIYSIQDDDNEVVGIQVPILKRNGKYQCSAVNTNVKQGTLLIFYQDVEQITNNEQLLEYAEKGRYCLIVNNSGLGLLTYDPEKDDTHLMVSGAWNALGSGMGNAMYITPYSPFSGHCSWIIEADTVNQLVYLKNSASGRYLGLNDKGSIEMSTERRGHPFLYFDEEGVVSSCDPSIPSITFGIDLTRPNDPVQLMGHNDGTKWLFLSPEPELANYYQVESNHEQGGINLLVDGLDYRSGQTFIYTLPIRQETWPRFFSTIELEGYTPTVNVTLDEETHHGKIQVTYDVDLAGGNYFHLHPSVQLSDYSQYYVNDPFVNIDSDGDSPMLGITTESSEYGEWQLELVGAVAQDTSVQIGASYAQRCTDEGALISRTIPKGTPLYRIHLKDKGYLRFIPEALTGEKVYAQRNANCFNFTSNPEKAETFIFWEVDQWLSQSTAAQEMGLTAQSHNNEYYIIPKSSFGHYNENQSYASSLAKDYEGFGQLMLCYTGFKGSTTDASTRLGLDCMREVRYAADNTRYYDRQSTYSYPWCFSPVSRTKQYIVHIKGSFVGGIKYGGKEYQDGDTLQASDLISTDLRIKPVLGTHYTVKVKGDQIKVQYNKHQQITSLDQLEEGHLYTIRSYADRGYWAHNQDNRYNARQDENGVMLIGTYSDDVTYSPSPARYDSDLNMQWVIMPTGRNSESGIPQYYVAAEGSGRFISAYYNEQDNDYAFFRTRQTSSPLYGLGIKPGPIEGTFMFVSEMARSYRSEIDEKTFENVFSHDGLASWDDLRSNYAYATPEESYSAGMLNYRGTWCTGDGILFKHNKKAPIESNPLAMLWYIEETNLHTIAPFFIVKLSGLPTEFNSDEVQLQLMVGSTPRHTIYEPFKNNQTRILSPYTHSSVNNASISISLKGSLKSQYELVSSSCTSHTWTFTFSPTSGIDDVIAEHKTSSIIDLSGRQMKDYQKGLMIKDGKVVLLK